MTRNSLLRLTSAFGAIASALTMPQIAMAQNNSTGSGQTANSLEVVTVTAERRAEKSYNVPITITTLSSDQLATVDANSLADTAKLTPGLRFDTQGPAMQATIRGVGTAITTSGGGPNVGIYLDGFFMPNTYAYDLQLMNVKSIQVLKGPQGTLFGRNTTGGAILVTTADPSTTPEMELKASYGRFNALTLHGYATAGLTDNVAVDIEGVYRRGDGFQTNTLTGNNNYGKYKDWKIRTGLKAQITDGLSVLVRYSHSDSNDPMTQLTNAYVDKSGDAGFLKMVSPAGRAIYGKSSSKGLPLIYFYAPAGTYQTQPGKIALDARTGFHAKVDEVQGTIKADLGFAILTSYTQYRHDSTPYYGDLDATALPFFGIFVGVNDNTVSQEFLLNSATGSRLKWTAGANYFQYKDTWNVKASFGGAPFIGFGGSSTNTKSYAAFLDATYQLTDKLFVTAGARYSHDVVTDAYFLTNPYTFSYTGPKGQTIPFVGPSGTVIPVHDLAHNTITPRFVVRYKPTDDSSVYASYTRGYKAGILNVGGLSQEPVKPEKIGAYEVGYKIDTGIFSFDVSSYYYDYKDLQVSSYQSGAAQIRNAASSKIYGVDGQFRYLVANGLTVNGGLSWLHARYSSFPNAPYYSYCDPAAGATNSLYCVPPALGGAGPGSIVETTVNAKGFHMQRAPALTGNLGATYNVEVAKGLLTLSGNLYYTSSFYFDPEQQFKQGGYSSLSLRAQWQDESGRYTIAVFGNNVTDERHLTQVLFTTLGTGAVWNAPATYGIQLGVKI